MKRKLMIGGVIATLTAAGTVVAGEVATSAIHAFNSGDTLEAKDLNDNFEQLRSAVSDNATNQPRLVGKQDTSFSNPVNIATTTWTGIESLTINAGPDPVTIKFTMHVVVEGGNLDGSDRYRFGICKGSASNANLVGAGWWRPPSTSNQYQATTITATGFDTGVTGAVDYSICGAKLNSADRDVAAYRRGIVATIMPE
jgi:hypothetical protein